MDCLADGKAWSGLVVEEPLNLVVEVDGSASKLDPDKVIVLFERKLLREGHNNVR